MKKFIKYICVIVLIFSSFYLNYFLKIKDNSGSGAVSYSTCLHKESVVLKENTPSDTLNLYAQSAVLIDAETKRVLYGKNADKEMPMASTTKIMTCICALENGNPDDVVTVSSNAAGQPKVHLGVIEGEQYKLKDLLYSLMLESHNDAAVAIAEHISGSVEKFAELMNQKARDLGCYNTYFITPNGLDSKVTMEDNSTKIHHTTAVDLAKIMNYCVHNSVKSEEFLEITRTKSHNFSDMEGKRNLTVTNHNAALETISGALSGKTGFTNDAGYCYVGAFEEGEHKFIVALLACGWPNNRQYKWADCRILLNYGNNNFSYVSKDINDYAVKLPSVKVYKSSCFLDEYRNMEVEIKDEEQFMTLESENDGETITYFLPKAVEAPVSKDIPLGIMFYKVNDTVIKSFPIYAKEIAGKPGLKKYVDNIVSIFFDMVL